MLQPAACALSCQPACLSNCIQAHSPAPTPKLSFYDIQPACASSSCKPSPLNSVMETQSYQCTPACMPLCTPQCIGPKVLSKSLLSSPLSPTYDCVPQCMPHCITSCLQSIIPLQPLSMPESIPASLPFLHSSMSISAPLSIYESSTMYPPLKFQQALPITPLCISACSPTCDLSCLQTNQKNHLDLLTPSPINYLQVPACTPACQPLCSLTCTQQV